MDERALHSPACFVILDMQRDFIDRSGHYASKPRDISPLLKVKQALLGLLPRIHRKIPILYIMAEYEPGQFRANENMCIKGTRGQELVLDRKYASNVFIKYDWSAFTSTEFREYLSKNAIKTVLLAGVLTEYCIKESAMDGLHSGFNMIIVQDLVGSAVEKQKEGRETLAELSAKGAQCITSQDLMNMLSKN